MASNTKTRRPAHLELVADPPCGCSRQWLTVHDFADELGVSIWTAYQWSRRGYPDFPVASRLPNNQIRIRRTDLVDWVQGRAA